MLSFKRFCDPEKKLIPKPFSSDDGNKYLRTYHVYFFARDHTD